MEPPNFRILDLDNPDLSLRDNPSINCKNCFFYSEAEKDKVGIGICTAFNYEVAKFAYEEEIQGFMSVSVNNLSSTQPITESKKVYYSDDYICDYYLPASSMTEYAYNPIWDKCGLFCFYIILTILTTSLFSYFGFGIIGFFIGVALSIIINYFSSKKIDEKAEKIKIQLEKELASHREKVDKFLKEKRQFSTSDIASNLKITPQELIELLKIVDCCKIEFDDSYFYIPNQHRLSAFAELKEIYTEYKIKKKTSKLSSLQTNNKIDIHEKNIKQFCSNCGSPINDEMIYCPGCGQKIK
ncbi:MAG: zinc-ribbon domain-containing protein [Promethearchaeota archaeon]